MRHPLHLLLPVVLSVALIAASACNEADDGGGDTSATGDDTGADDTSATGDDTATDDTATDDTATDDTHVAGTPEPVLTPVALSRDSTCAVAADGTGYCWGSNTGKKLGAGPGGPTQALEPNPIADTHTWAAFGIGVEHACGLDTDGAAWCWGTGWAGELGNGQSTVVPAPAAVSGGHSFVDIDAFDHYACALDADGQVWCWGDNKDGQFGDGTTEGSLEPVAGGAMLTIAELDLGRRNACGVTPAGELHCWGDTYGADTQLGPDQTWMAVSAGEGSVCAIDSAGGGWCWGGIADTGSETPEPIPGDHTWSALSFRAEHICGLDMSGAAWCWGSNFKGQLGDGNHGRENEQDAPTAVSGGHLFVDIAAGDGHTCATTGAGELYCWGYNEWGEIGNGEISAGANPTPALVLGGLTWATP